MTKLMRIKGRKGWLIAMLAVGFFFLCSHVSNASSSTLIFNFPATGTHGSGPYISGGYNNNCYFPLYYVNGCNVGFTPPSSTIANATTSGYYFSTSTAFYPTTFSFWTGAQTGYFTASSTMYTMRLVDFDKGTQYAVGYAWDTTPSSTDVILNGSFTVSSIVPANAKLVMSLYANQYAVGYSDPLTYFANEGIYPFGVYIPASWVYGDPLNVPSIQLLTGNGTPLLNGQEYYDFSKWSVLVGNWDASVQDVWIRYTMNQLVIDPFSSSTATTSVTYYDSNFTYTDATSTSEVVTVDKSAYLTQYELSSPVCAQAYVRAKGSGEFLAQSDEVCFTLYHGDFIYDVINGSTTTSSVPFTYISSTGAIPPVSLNPIAQFLQPIMDLFGRWFSYPPLGYVFAYMKALSLSHDVSSPYDFLYAFAWIPYWVRAILELMLSARLWVLFVRYAMRRSQYLST